jgi:hypothetical protein
MQLRPFHSYCATGVIMQRSPATSLSVSKFSFAPKLATLVLAILSFSIFSFAAPPDRITGPITSQHIIRLSAGVPMRARSQHDQGPVDSSLKLSYMTLLTAPSASQRAALMQLLAQQQDRNSPLYHKWLTPEEYADRFGLSSNDVAKITGWLESQGFAIVRTARGRNFVVFSGTAAQVEKTFQTEIHSFEINGQPSFANTKSPMIPAALSGIVTGFHGLSNFRPKSQAQRGDPAYTIDYKTNDYYFLAPGDIAAMYDVGTLQSSLDGTGQKIAVMGQTGIYQSDLTNFRLNFGLSAISCTTSGDIITSCSTPNFKYILVNGTAETIYDNPNGSNDLPEADLDIEWSGATAPKAQVIFVDATDPNGFGTWDSWYYAVDNNVAPVITMSYTAPCELAEAETPNGQGTINPDEGTFVADEAELKEANLEGITFLNSTGDTGAAECDYGANSAVNGYATSYPASSQYITGVGGTSIPRIDPDEYIPTFWNPSNGTGDGSAKGYIQEQAWNDAEEFGLLCTPSNSCVLNHQTVTSWATAQTAIGLSAGGGGVSNCVAIDANGVCLSGFPQPPWQSGISATAVNPNGFGVTNTPARYSPDVSLLASPNFPGYLVCTQVTALEGSGTGSACDSPTTGISDMLNGCLAGTGPCSIFGGTSVSTPVFAGMVALLNQYLGANGGLGNINPTLYTLAAANSTNHAFNPVTTASTGVYSNGAWCEEGSPTSGVTGDPWPTALQCPSTGANAGFLGFNSYDADPILNYNLVTGLGSVDANNLAIAWAASLLTATTITIEAAPHSIIAGQSVTLTATVTPSSATGTVSFFNNGSTTALGTAPLTAGIATLSTTSLPVGTDSISASYGGDSDDAPSSTTVSAVVTVTAPTFTLSTPTTPAPVLSGESTTSTFKVTPGGGTFADAVTFACNNLPTVSCGFSPTQIAAGATGVQTVTVTITTAGPNTSGENANRRRRADNRSPWLPLALPLAGIVMAGFAGRKMSKYSAITGLCVSLVLLGLLAACGGGSSPAPPIAVSVSLASGSSASIFPNYTDWPSQTATFNATVTNTSNTAVNWSLSSSVSCAATPSPCGSISSSGVYTAPTVATGLPGSVTITASSTADSSKSGSATETITPATVPTAIVGAPYSITVTATEGPTSNSTSAIALTVQ